jgi:hypothetical protein
MKGLPGEPVGVGCGDCPSLLIADGNDLTGRADFDFNGMDTDLIGVKARTAAKLFDTA